MPPVQKAKGKWALIHRVPIWGTGARPGAAGKLGSGVVGWKKVQGPGLWVEVGSAKWNRILAASAKTKAGIRPTKYVMSNGNPTLNRTTKLPGAAKLPAKGGSDTVIRDKAGNIIGAKNAKGQVVAGKGAGSGVRSSGPKPPAQHNQHVANTLIGKPGVNKTVNVNAGARAAGTEQFGAQIADNKTQQAEAGRQGSQDLADITNWYDALAKQNSAGAAANVASTQAASQHVANAASSFMDLIGGSANPNSQTIGNHALDAIQSILSSGQGQADFEQNRGEADTAAQAGQMSAQQAVNSQTMLGLQQALADLQTQRGAAVTLAKQSLQQQNNAALQANFGNRIARLDAVIGANQAMGNQRLQNVQIGLAQHQLSQQNQNAKNGKGPNFVPWDQLTTSAKLQAVSAMMSGDPSKTPYAVAVARGHAMGFAPQKFQGLLNTYYGK